MIIWLKNFWLMFVLQYRLRSFLRGVKTLAVAIDTSGSIREDWIHKYAHAVNSAMLGLGISGTVIQFSHEIVNQEDFTNCFDVGEIHSYGGTLMKPVFKVVDGKYDAMVCLTDGYMQDMPDHVEIPLFWALVAHQKEFIPQLGLSATLCCT